MAGDLQLSVIKFNKDAYITIEGKASDDTFYIIKEGSVSVKREALNEVETLKPGDFFGVISAMSNHNNVETTQALTNVSLIKVHKDQFPLLIQKNNPVAMKIILFFSKKLRELDKEMAEITLKSISNPDDVSNLYNIGIYYYDQKKYNQAFYALYKFLHYCKTSRNVDNAKKILGEIKDLAKCAYLDAEKSDFKRIYPDETTIFCEHEPGNEMYIIQQGKVKITKIIENKEVLLAVLKEGDVFGEMALLENKPRVASAISYGESRVMAVNKDNFQSMISSQPQLVTKIITLLAERTWVVYRQLINLKISSEIGRTYDMLLIQLEKNRIPIKAGSSYKFEFGPKELINMVGLSSETGRDIIREIFKNKKFQLEDDKIFVKDIDEIKKMTEYYIKMELLEKKRKEKHQSF